MTNPMTLAEITKVRRDLHQIPELGFDVFQTKQYLEKQLISFGYTVQTVGKTGVLVHKQGRNKACLLFRADMDALPIHEQTACDFVSQIPGHMHACGHDGHMAILLGFAKNIAQQKDLPYSILLLFQPAEEGPGGAKVIIEEGLFRRYPIIHAFGLHLFPELDEGVIGYKAQGFMAQSGEVDLHIQGISAHGAKPHLGRDALLASAALVSSYQSIVSRSIDPLEEAVVTIGTIHGGDARNIIAASIRLEGTIRAFHPNNYQLLKDRMIAIAKGIELSHDVVIQTTIRDFYPVVYNDPTLTNRVFSSLSEIPSKEIKPMMFAEDFSYYSQEVPSLFVMLGTKNTQKGYTHPLHSSRFQFDESVLLSGVAYFEWVIRVFMESSHNIDFLN